MLTSYTSDIVFVGNARCYHTMDWYRNAKEIVTPRRVVFATDLVESEGHTRIVSENDDIIKLYNIDWLLLRKQSTFGNIWRNIVKLLLVPVQAKRIRVLAREMPLSVFHAHTMYYMFLCWIAGVGFVGTPQGSEILVRPRRSRMYRYFAIKSLMAARGITVDSASMQREIRQLCGREAVIVQNGINVAEILELTAVPQVRSQILSIRAIYPNYRIDKIFDARSRSRHNPPLTLIYPFWEDSYLESIRTRITQDDLDLGRLARSEMYQVMASTSLAVSIPSSDSSPRSVYEAVFCGCCVAVTPGQWIEDLPACMKARLFLVNLENDDWLDEATEQADLVTREPFIPSERALELFDQRASMAAVVRLFY